MYKLCPLVTQDILIKVYFALIYPFLLYAIHIWGNTFINTLSSLIKLQKKIVRLITYNDFIDHRTGNLVHSEPLFLKLNILTFYDIFKLQMCNTGARIWNLIPLKLRISPSKIYFSKILCKYFRSMYI